MKSIFRKILPHLAVAVLFVAISLAFFYPVLQGKVIFQSDIVQYTAMAKERNDLRTTQKEESYWTNSAFGGMPTYQLGANYPYDFIKKIDRAIRFLPRPADYLFLYFIGFYLLLLAFKTDYKTAFLGAIAFGFSSYLIIILGVGHNAKAHAIGYFAPVLAGVLWIFNRKYLWGGLLTAFALALEINANHFQMTYYLMLLVMVLVFFEFYKSLKINKLKTFVIPLLVLFGAFVVSLLSNATSLLATQEYAQWSTRGKSDLTISPDGSHKPASGLSKDYITEYSYGISESLNLIVPRLFGGSNNEALGKDAKTYSFLVEQGVPPLQALDFSNRLPTYWGEQPIVAAPAYIGAVVFFLFVLALFLVKGHIKWWLVAGISLSLLLSWGKNFGLLTDFMIDYFPLYNKFRAVSSIQVILELCVPLLAMLGLYQFSKNTFSENKKSLQYAFYVCLSLLALLLVCKGFFDFVGANDALYEQYYGREIVEMIQQDRKALYNSDLLRSAVFILCTALVLWLFQHRKLSKLGMYVAVSVLVLFDLVGVATRYVNGSSFVASTQMTRPFVPTTADTQILKDTSYFRVYEPEVGINGARTSYFHHSIGGYHAAKPKRLQELFDYQISKGNMQALNMLNVKYILLKDEKGRAQVIPNDEALGNAWFVENVVAKNTDDQLMQYLSDFQPKKEVVVLAKDFQKMQISQPMEVDSTAAITLKSYKPNRLVYQTDNHKDGFAVFSEVHYPKGWKVTIDGEPQECYRVNYLLRGMPVPSGKHTIIFEFEPEVISVGSKISLAGNILLLLWLAVGITWSRKRKKNVG